MINLYATDAPIDNPEITGAFVTISGVKINGDTNYLDHKTTVDLLAYQDGNTKDLGSFPIAAGDYDEVELILDLQQDAFGQTPGCYISTRDGIKHNIAISTYLQKSLFLIAPFSIGPDQEINMVLDFDLRKAIKIDTGNVSVKYQFVPDHQLQFAIRCLNIDQTGTIEGILEHETAFDETIVVMAYQRGFFSERSETIPNNVGGITFNNASNSTQVKSNGSFTLAFLPRGSYELVFASYSDEDQDGVLE